MILPSSISPVGVGVTRMVRGLLDQVEDCPPEVERSVEAEQLVGGWEPALASDARRFQARCGATISSVLCAWAQ